MRDKGTRHGAAGHRLHHRGFDLKKSPLVEEKTDLGNQPAAPPEGGGNGAVGNKVEVALAEAGLDVGQTVPLFREGPKRLGEKIKRPGSHGQLPRSCAEQGALYSQVVADIHQLAVIISLWTKRIPREIDLDPPRSVLEMGKGHLTMASKGHQ